MKADGFFFNVKQWLGDDSILLMDWDVRAMHFHLMCIAWQQTPPGVITANEAIIKKWLGSPEERDWTARIRPQISRSWTISESSWTQGGLVREWERQTSTSQKRRAAAAVRWDREKTRTETSEDLASGLTVELSKQDTSPGMECEEAGIDLKSVIKKAASVFEPCSKEERSSIWSVGISLLKHDDFDENKVRSFLAKMVHENGEKKVAEAIAQLSLKPLKPVDAKSYLIGIMKAESGRRKGRGKVAL